MRTIDEDAALAPDNPIEEGIGMTWPHKGSTMSMGKPQQWFQNSNFQEGNSRDQPQGWQ